MSDSDNLKVLGEKMGIPKSPDEAILDTFENQHQDVIYLVPFVCNEFTSLCPKTGQPDFARFEIIYSPNVFMIESKALKLYLSSFRNEGSFHEDVTNRIFKDLWEVMGPRYMRIIGDFTVRGGISIKPMVEKFNPEQSAGAEIIHLVEQWDRVKNNLQ